MKRFLSLALIPVLLSSCFHKKVTRHETLPEIEVTAKRRTANQYKAAAPLAWDITHSRVALSFNWKEKTAAGKEWIDLHPYFYATDTLALDAKGMKIDSVVMVANGMYNPLAFIYKDDQLRIKFNKAYLSTDSIRLYVRYKAMPYDVVTGGSAAITDDRGLYFINTDFIVPGKPAQIWTQGESEANSHWMPTIDKPNSRFTVQVELTVPDTMQTLGNGYKVSATPAGNGLRTDIWKEDMPIQAYAVMFAIGRYAILKDEWRGKEVNYYVEPEYAPYGREMFRNTPEMIEYFSKITGVLYPWNKYDQVVVRDYVSGAMENTTASLYGEFMNENNREIADKDYEDVVSHELFHQWFGDYVTCESWSNITVNESFANYSEQLWRRYKYGAASADKLAFDDLNKYIGYSAYSDEPLLRFYYDDKEKVFDPISYEKGGMILSYLNTLIGDAAFDKAMNIYLTKNALHAAEATNWRLAVEEATGQDWNWFFNEWYYRGGHPELDVKYNYNDSAKQLIVTVTQKQDDTAFAYQLPLKTAIVYGTEKTITDWNIQSRKEVYTYPYKNDVKPVIIPDETHVLPGTLSENKKPAGWLTQYQASSDYINKRKALGGALKDIADNNSQALIDLALNDRLVDIRVYALAMLGSLKSDKWHDKWKAQVQQLAVSDVSKKVRASAFDVLNVWKVAEAKQGMMTAVYDSSYAVAGAALDALNTIDSDAAYPIAKELLKANPKGDLDATIWDVIGRRANDNDVSLFIKHAPYYYGTKKFQFATGLYTYLKIVKNDVSFDQGVALMAKLAMEESIKGYRNGLTTFLFHLAKAYKTNAAADHKAEAAHDTQRMELVKGYIEKAMNAEKDPDNREKNKEALRSLNEDKE